MKPVAEFYSKKSKGVSIIKPSILSLTKLYKSRYYQEIRK
jgi:hypothetical protein